MSYSCATHGWQHLINPCPMCSTYSFSDTTKNIMNPARNSGPSEAPGISRIEFLNNVIIELKIKLDAAIEVLEFYSQDRFYSSSGVLQKILDEIEEDSGKKAKEALSKIK